MIKISEKGLKQLSRLYSSLKFIMEHEYPPSVTLEGI